MRIAYLAPELPALSATFVYNEILQLEKAGTRVIPFSVHRPNGHIDSSEVQQLSARVTHLYERSKLAVLKSHFRLIKRFPKQYLSAVWLLLTDMFKLSVQRKLRTAIGIAYRFFYAASLADELVKHRCDHLHVHFAHIPTDIAMYASEMSDIGFSVTAHANDLFERGWLLKEKVSRSRFFGTISEFNQHFLLEKGADVSKIEIIRCGVDSSQFSPRKGHVASTPVKLGLVGRLVEKKGVDVLLKAMAILREQGQNVQLYIAGSGPLVSELKDLTFDLGLDEKSVVFLGSIPHKEVAEFVESLDIFVLPCKRDSQGDMDGIPVVLMEAMLSGVPVISSQISGIPELVIDRETGRCIEPSNPGALALAVVDMLSDTNKAQSMCNAAESLVREQFSLSENVVKLDQLFRRSGTYE
jgi:glycosyltransferase involved in cell wall biosynthesis